MTHVRTFARAETLCDGLRARVAREVSEAARSDDADRLTRLAYWHARQRAAEHLYYLHGLCFARSSNNAPPRFSGLGRYACPSESWLNAEV